MAATLVRLPDDLHHKLRWLAFKEKRSQNAIILEVLEKALKKVVPPKEAK